MPDLTLPAENEIQRPTAGAEAPPAASLGALLAPAAAALLSACGGGGESATADVLGAERPLPAAFADSANAPTRALLLAQPPDGAARRQPQATTPQRVPTSTELFDYAERAYPQFFPTHEINLRAQDIVYRHYPTTGNYVGVQGSDVLVLGPMSDHVLTRVGSLQDFAQAVLGTTPTATVRSDEDAARFLLHATFAASPQEIARVRALGYEAWLNAELARPNSQSGCDWLVEKGYSAIDENEFFFAFGSNHFMIWAQLFQSPDALRRRWALALSEIFVVSWRGIKDVQNWDNFAIGNYWDLLCAHAFGNYRDLLQALTLCPAMGAFLGTRGNLKEDLASGRQPDENYAREVMQLFSIGTLKLHMDGSLQLDDQGRPIETYGASDVSQLARVFTGWNEDRSEGYFTNPKPPHQRVWHRGAVTRPMVLDPQLHSPLEKRFLGIVIPAGTSAQESMRIALDTLANHPNTAPFLARQFIQRLVTSDPSPAYIERVARAFANNGAGVRGDLKAVLCAVLLDAEARGSQSLASTTFGKLREPMLRVAQWGRSFKLRSKLGRWKVAFGPWNSNNDLGQYPLDPPSVFSYFRPGYVPPGTAMAARNATAPEFQIVNESSVAAWTNWLQDTVYGGIWTEAPDRPGRATPSWGNQDVVPDYSAEVALIGDTPALVAHLNLLLCAGQLSAAEVELIVDALRQDHITASASADFKHVHVVRAICLVMSSAGYLVQR